MRFILLLVMALTLWATPTAEEFDARVWKFQQHWNRFLRAYWGCAPTVPDKAGCNSTLSRIDRREYEASRQAALDLFEITGRR